MRCVAMVVNQFRDKAIATGIDADVTFRIVCRVDVHLHGRINIVEAALADDFLLAAKEMNFPFFHQLFPVFNFNAFFTGDGKEKEDDVATEILHGIRIF